MGCANRCRTRVLHFQLQLVPGTVEMDKWVEERKEGREEGSINASKVLISSIPYQCQTVLDVYPELGAAKQGGCSFSDLAFYELPWVSTASRH